MLNQIYYIQKDLEKQKKKQITLWMVPIHIGVKGNKEANKAAKKQ